MIALPVLADRAPLDTLGRTAAVTAVEGLDRKLGSADALVTSRRGPRDRSTRTRRLPSFRPGDDATLPLPTPPTASQGCPVTTAG